MSSQKCARVCVTCVHNTYVRKCTVDEFVFLLCLTSILINCERAAGLLILFYCRICARSSPDNTMRYGKRRIFLSSVYACADIAFWRTVVVFSAAAHFRSRRWYHGARLCFCIILYYNTITRQVLPSPTALHRRTGICCGSQNYYSRMRIRQMQICEKEKNYDYYDLVVVPNHA